MTYTTLLYILSAILHNYSMEYCKSLHIASYECTTLTQTALYCTCECALIDTRHTIPVCPIGPPSPRAAGHASRSRSRQHNTQPREGCAQLVYSLPAVRTILPVGGALLEALLSSYESQGLSTKSTANFVLQARQSMCYCPTYSCSTQLYQQV